MDPRRRELIDKVWALVAGRYGGDYRTAFDHYDADKDGVITMAELISLLYDAGIGSRITRNAWAHGIIDALDSDNDDRIAWAEFEKALNQNSAAYTCPVRRIFEIGTQTPLE